MMNWRVPSAETNSVAKIPLAANLSGRRPADLEGPRGLDPTCALHGSLGMPEAQDGANILDTLGRDEDCWIHVALQPPHVCK